MQQTHFFHYSNAVLWSWPGIAVLFFSCHQVALFWLNNVQMESKPVPTVFILHLFVWLSQVPAQPAAQKHILMLTVTFVEWLVITNSWLVSGYLTRMWRVLKSHTGNIFLSPASCVRSPHCKIKGTVKHLKVTYETLILLNSGEIKWCITQLGCFGGEVMVRFAIHWTICKSTDLFREKNG